MSIRNIVTRLLAGFAVIAAMLGAALPAQAEGEAPDPAAAREFIRDLSDRGVTIWRDPTITQEEREAKFRVLLHEGFAVDYIARLVLGRHARTASREQLSEYMRLFPSYTVNSFANRMGDYGNEQVEVNGTVDAGDRDIFVRTRLLRPGGEPVFADWRLRSFDEGLKIVDVKVEGVSMALTQREEFSSIVAKSGIEGLLQEIRSKADVQTARAAE